MPYGCPAALRKSPPDAEFNNIFRRLLIGLVILAGLVACQNSADSAFARVQRVIDGDSIQVNLGGEILEVRLGGIDAPEYRQPYAPQAKQLLSEMVLDREVLLQEQELDRYGRTIALVVRAGDELIVNAELVRQGAAWAHPQYAQPAWFRLEQQARAAKRGLWGSNRPVPPWDWRRDRGTTHSRK